jgi:signal transduction histidine kinase/ActR/RegA family two-component response regulator
MSAITLSPSLPTPSYVEAMAHLVEVVQSLSQARDIDAISAIVRKAARDLTGADGATFVLRDGNQCYYADEDAIEPLWKGKRFPMEACVSGWVMHHGQSTVINDIYDDARVPTEAYRPTFVKSLAMVPIRRNAPIGAIGNYWATQRQPTDEEVSILQALADTTSVALENAELYGQLRAQVATLETQHKRILDQKEALEVFTRALSHDLREPVRTMKAFSGLIAHEPVSEDGRTYLKLISEASDRMAMLIDTVFQYTQLDDPSLIRKEPCDMAAVLKAAKENMAHLIIEQGARIENDDLPAVTANPTQIMQVLQNLIANAIRHNPAPVYIRVSAKRHEGMWQFCVRDNGAGISPEFLSRIFEPFRRLNAREDSAGMGLAICQKIVTSYGGKLWCESQPGAGAAFYFTLPDDETLKPATVSASEPAQAQGLANVLLVDDREADIVLTKLTLLNRKGLQCKLFVANGADEAHEILTEAHRMDDQIDLMLLDINMPRINGFELLERVRKDDTLKDTAVVMCTGSAHEPDKRNAEALGAVGYVIKPPSLDKLRPVLEQIAALRVQEDGESFSLLRAG